MTQKQTHIPKFKSIAEEAAFWDAHDTTDFADEFTPVKVKFGKNLLAQGITIRFDARTLSLLRKKAAEKGIGATTLVRMWTLERLQTI